MSAPKDPLSYPEHFFTIITKVVDEGQVIDIPTSNKTMKHQFGIMWYGFRTALSREPMFAELYRKSMQITVSLKPRGIIRFMPVNNSDIGLALTSALGALDPTPALAPESAPIQATDFVDSDGDTVVLMSKYFGGKK